MRFAGCKYAVQQLDNSLSLEFRERTSNWKSHHVAVRHELQVLRIGELEHVFRTTQQAAKADGLEPPRPRVGGDQSSFLAALQSLRGDAFDREYARQQMLAHASALATLRSYADKGSDGNLRRWAASTSPTIERHLQSARQLMQLLGVS